MPTFTFVEFNPRRAARGAEAARVEVSYEDGASELLWMSKRDIARNMMAFGPSEDLQKAHDAYRAKAAASPPVGQERQGRG